jgi:hypothetical protein
LLRPSTQNVKPKLCWFWSISNLPVALAGGTEEAGAVEGGSGGVHALAAGIAGFANEVWIHRVGDPSNTVIILGLGQLQADFVFVIIEHVGDGSLGGESPVITSAGEIVPSEVSDLNFDGGGW